jgi:hypothetical protein
MRHLVALKTGEMLPFVRTGTETQEKDVRIELRTETQLSAAIEPSPPIHEMQPLSPVSSDQIAERNDSRDSMPTWPKP